LAAPGGVAEAMASQLIVSFSGVRGVVGESLTAEVAARFADAHLDFLRRTRGPFPADNPPLIVLGRDSRPSGPMLREGVLRAWGAGNCRVADIGIVPTPTVPVAMAELGAVGGLIITASHNPGQWNGMKFLLGPDCTALDEQQIEEVFAHWRGGTFKYDPTAAPAATEDLHREAMEWHLARVFGQVDQDRVRAGRFRVALDHGNGAGGEITPLLLERLGCAVEIVDSHRESEPTAESLAELSQFVVDHGCAVGFAQDLDADRLAVVDETGRAIGEEQTLGLAVAWMLQRHRGEPPVVVKNTSTSQLIDDLAAAAGAEVAEVRVGEVNLSRRMIDLLGEGRTVFGGEGNGGVINPVVGYGRDSLVGMSIILEYLATTGKPCSALADALPAYRIIKEKIACTDRAEAAAFLIRMKNAFAGEKMAEFDGLKVRFADGAWCQARLSNTEPIVRIIAEAPTAERARALIEQLRGLAA
jgi:phosphomannomutase